MIAKTPIDNVRLTTLFAGEAEVRLADPWLCRVGRLHRRDLMVFHTVPAADIDATIDEASSHADGQPWIVAWSSVSQIPTRKPWRRPTADCDRKSSCNLQRLLDGVGRRHGEGVTVDLNEQATSEVFRPIFMIGKDGKDERIT